MLDMGIYYYFILFLLFCFLFLLFFFVFLIHKNHYFFLLKNHFSSISGAIFSLDDIMHGILRGNKHPRDTRDSSYFTENDPRVKFCAVNPSPEFHFLVCTHMVGSPYARVLDSSEKFAISLKLGAAHYIGGEKREGGRGREGKGRRKEAEEN